MVAERKGSHDPAFEGCDEILSFVAEANAAGKPVKITDLVQYIVYGTGPTVHRKCNLLIERGLLTSEVSESDRRVKVLMLTKQGHKFLADRNNLMLQIIKETNPVI